MSRSGGSLRGSLGGLLGHFGWGGLFGNPRLEIAGVSHVVIAEGGQANIHDGLKEMGWILLNPREREDGRQRDKGNKERKERKERNLYVVLCYAGVLYQYSSRKVPNLTQGRHKPVLVFLLLVQLLFLSLILPSFSSFLLNFSLFTPNLLSSTRIYSHQSIRTLHFHPTKMAPKVPKEFPQPKKSSTKTPKSPKKIDFAAVTEETEYHQGRR